MTDLDRSAGVWERIRPDVSVLMLGLSAALFLLLGTVNGGAGGNPSQLATSATGAGFALAGGAIVRYFDVFDRRRRERQAEENERLRAADETRRVVSIALEAIKDRSTADLVATVSNALSKHDLGHRKVPYEDAATHFRAVLSQNDLDGSSERWIRARLDDLNTL